MTCGTILKVIIMAEILFRGKHAHWEWLDFHIRNLVLWRTKSRRWTVNISSIAGLKSVAWTLAEKRLCLCARAQILAAFKKGCLWNSMLSLTEPKAQMVAYICITFIPNRTQVKVPWRKLHICSDSLLQRYPLVASKKQLLGLMAERECE